MTASTEQWDNLGESKRSDVFRAVAVRRSRDWTIIAP